MKCNATYCEFARLGLENSADLEILDIVVPCVDQSSIQDIAARSRFQQQLAKIIPHAEKLGVNLSLETDLGPEVLKDLLAQLDSSKVTVKSKGSFIYFFTI